MIALTKSGEKALREILTVHGLGFYNATWKVLRRRSRRESFQVDKNMVAIAEKAVIMGYGIDIHDFRERFRELVDSGTKRSLARRMARREADRILKPSKQGELDNRRAISPEEVFELHGIERHLANQTREEFDPDEELESNERHYRLRRIPPGMVWNNYFLNDQD